MAKKVQEPEPVDDSLSTFGGALADIQEQAAKGGAIEEPASLRVLPPPPAPVRLGVEAEPEPAPLPVAEPVVEPVRDESGRFAKPDVLPVEDDEDDDEPHAPAAEADPAWIAKLPEAERAEARDYVKSLRGSVAGAHAASQRRKNALRDARRDRQDAIAIALDARKRLAERDGVLGDDDKPGAHAPLANGRIKVELDDDGKTVLIDPAQIAELVQRQQAPQLEAQARASEAGRVANSLLAEAGVSMPTQQRLLGAFKRMSALYVEALDDAGLRGRAMSAGQERDLMRQAGVDKVIAAEFDGVALEDLYDVFEGSQDPWNRGHHLVGAASKYERKWGKPGGGDPSAPRKPNDGAPIPIGRHPAPMSRKGESARTASDAAIEATKDISFNDALALTPDQMDARVRAWEQEQGQVGLPDFTRRQGLR